MYVARSRGTKYTTITFASTGGACAARLMYNTDANILNDVDPSVQHSQITDYTHPLDPWGNAILGVDNGRVCLWGSTDLSFTNSSAREYCGRVYGYSGPTLIAAQGGAYFPGGADSTAGLDFRRCRYFTHDAEATLLALQQPGVVNSDGTTDGGCRDVPVIPTGDTSSEGCPTGSLSTDEKVFISAVVIAAVVSAICLCCCCMAAVYFFCVHKKRQVKKTDPKEGQGLPSPVA